MRDGAQKIGLPCASNQFVPAGPIGKDAVEVPKRLDEKVASLHLEKIGVKLDKLSKAQADYLGVDVSGPYKSDHYRY